MMSNTPKADHQDTDGQLKTASTFAYSTVSEPAVMECAALAGEVALAISYNGISQAVMMVSPSNIDEFVTGFSLSTGIISSPDQLLDVHLSSSGESLHAELEISSRAFWALKQSRRQLAGTSGCGLCGVDALEQALPTLTPLTPAPIPAAALFANLRQRVNDAQLVARQSGAVHAALYIDQSGQVTLCREDIGRHNALDKLIGALLYAKVNAGQGFVVVTSRCSLELIHKAVRAKIATLVCLSAPTALSVQWAQRYGLNLIHVPHHSAPRCYSPAPKYHP